MNFLAPPVDVEGADAPLEPHQRHPSLASLGVPGALQGTQQTGFAAGIYGRVLLSACYLTVSTGMVLYNKHLMEKDHFPFASVIILGHMVITLILASVLWLFLPNLFPMATAMLHGRARVGLDVKDKGLSRDVTRTLLRFFPIAASGALCLVFTNSAYKYNGVSELQMVKETGIVMVYVMSVIAGLEVPNLRNFLVLMGVTVCAILAVCGPAHMLIYGLALQVVASIFQSMQIVLTNVMMVQDSGPKADPLTMVLCTAPGTIFMLLPVNYVLWDPIIISRMVLWWPQLLASGLAAFTLQVLATVTIRELSATGFTVVSVLKDLVLVGSASFLLGEYLTVTQLCGFVGAVMGVSVYSWIKLHPDRY